MIDMKKNVLKIILTSFFFVLSFVVTAQTEPPDPGDNEENSSEALGGTAAPIGGGIFILMALGAAYAGKKGYTLYKENWKKLTD